MRALLVAFALCAVVPPAVAGYVYRWSENGVDHFSDIEHAGAERVWVPDDAKSRGGGTASPGASGGEGAAADPLKDPKSPEFLKMRCDQKTAELNKYEGAIKIVERNGAGTEHEYTPEERDKLIALTKADVVKYCGEGETASP